MTRRKKKQQVPRENYSALAALSRLKSSGMFVTKPMNGYQGRSTDGEMIVPQVITFTGYPHGFGKTYRNPDEAWRHNKENARYMRNDLAVMECVEARQRAVALLPWHLETDEPKKAKHKELVESMTAIIKKIPRFTEYRRNLLEAIWYGRYAVQHNFGRRIIKGRSCVSLVGNRNAKAWSPIQGDKLAFHTDSERVGIRIGWGFPADQKTIFTGGRERQIHITPEYGRVYWLDDDERDRIALHAHMIEDGDFEDPLSAGAINGIGIRDRIYWTWFQKQNLLGMLLEYLERSAMGFEIWTYEAANPQSLEKVQAAATNRVGFGKNIVFLPRIVGQEDVYSVEHQETGMAGYEAVDGLIHRYFEWLIKRYILGQVLSTEPESGGLGSSGITDFQDQSLRQVLCYDARNLEETLTTDLLTPLKWRNRWVLPLGSDEIEVRCVIDTESDQMKETLDAICAAIDKGLKVKSETLYELLGIEKPTDDDETIGGQPDPDLGGPGGPGLPGGPPAGGDGASLMDGQPGGEESVPLSLLDKVGAKFTRLQDKGFSIEKYRRDPDGGHWITIGGGEDGPGTHVKIDDRGRILAGPKGLADKGIKSLDDFALKREPAKREKDPKETQGKLFDEPKKLPHGVHETEDGRWLGTAQLKVSDLKADPARFQYKITGIDPRTGVTKELQEVKQFNPVFAGQLLVWRDPKNGEINVVNGHHRFDLAKRSGYEGDLSVRFLDAKDAGEARAWGALANIAEGRGSPIDAAKFMRDSDMTPQELAETGISLQGKIAEDGAVLARASNKIFQDLTNGLLTQGRAMAIVRHVTNGQHQDQLRRIVEQKENNKRRIPDNVVEEMAREMAMAGTRKVQGDDMFGDYEYEEHLFLERGQMKAWLRQQLTQDKTAFKAVSTSKRAQRLEETGANVIDVEGNRSRAQRADEALWAFNQLANNKGPLSDAINQAAKELADDPRGKKRIQRQLQERAIAMLAGEGAPAGDGEGSSGLAAERHSRTFDRSAGPSGPADRRERMIYALSEWARYTWDASKHPRGQPDNAGQFVKGGGSSSAKSEETEKPEKPEKPEPEKKRQPGHPALENLFTAEELSLPEDAHSPFETEDAVYDQAAKDLENYKAVVNMGKGVSKDLDADVLEIDSKEAFESMLEDFRNEPRGKPVIVLAPLKGHERASEKVNGKLEGKWSLLNDVVRGTIAVGSIDEIPGAIESVRKHMEARGWTFATKPNDRMTNPTPAGYRDVQLSLRSPDGMACELQINTKSMIVAKEGPGHKLYEAWRNVSESITTKLGKHTWHEAGEKAVLAEAQAEVKRTKQALAQEADAKKQKSLTKKLEDLNTAMGYSGGVTKWIRDNEAQQEKIYGDAWKISTATARKASKMRLADHFYAIGPIARYRKAWDETQHKRDSDGKFSSTGGDTATKPKPSKEEAKAKLKDWPTPESLPDEPESYFNMDQADDLVDIGKLTNKRARPEGIANAEKFMDMARQGENDKRDPISVFEEEDGTLTVADGNSTFNVAKKHGWEAVPVKFLTLDEYDALKAKDEAKASKQYEADLKAAQPLADELAKEGLGIPRYDMPQIAREHQDAFIDYLASEYGASAKMTEIPVGKLKGIQSELDPKKVAGIAGRIRQGTLKGGNPPLASRDGYILDGHHRWGAQRLVDPNDPMEVRQVDMDMQDLLDASHTFDETGYANVEDSAPVSKPQIGKSGAKIASTGSVEQHELKRLGIPSHEALPDVVGAPDDSEVKAFPSMTGGISIHVNGDGYTATRNVYQEDGRTVMQNVNFRIQENKQGGGIGTKMFAKQVEWAAKHGIDEIRTVGARHTDLHGKDTVIGYKVWPLMGYDGKLPKRQRDDLPSNLRGAKTVQDLYRTKAGREWWDKHGDDIELTFDLAEGSRSRRILDKYLMRKRAQRKIPDKLRRRGPRGRY